MYVGVLDIKCWMMAACHLRVPSHYLNTYWFVVDKTWWQGQQNKQIFIIPFVMISHPYPNVNYCGVCIRFDGVGSNDTMSCVRILSTTIATQINNICSKSLCKEFSSQLSTYVPMDTNICDKCYMMCRFFLCLKYDRNTFQQTNHFFKIFFFHIRLKDICKETDTIHALPINAIAQVWWWQLHNQGRKGSAHAVKFKIAISCNQVIPCVTFKSICFSLWNYVLNSSIHNFTMENKQISNRHTRLVGSCPN